MARPVPLIFSIVLLGATLSGCLGTDIQNETDEDGNLIGPSWSFTDTEGVTHSRDTSMGNATVLFFMASWCSSCRAQTEPLANVHSTYADDGLQVYTLSFDPTERKADLEQWKDRFKQPWPHGVDPQSQVAQTFRITAQSSLVVLDENGLVVRTFGFPGASENALDAAVAEAFSRGASGATA